MKKFVLVLVFCLSFAFGNQNLELIKGEAMFLEFERQNLVKLEVNGKDLAFFTHPKNKNKSVAIFALPYKNPPKNTEISVLYKDKQEKIFIKTLEGNYKSEVLQVQPSKISPPKSAQKRIEKELKEANVIYATYTPKALFSGEFQKPLDSFITSDYGKARTYNNQLSGYHGGTDFRAKTPTPIKAANSGIVRLAKDRYYAGNSVIIDHGYGIYSQYYHLSRIDVKPGQHIKKGEILGLSGATGRVSGPHLHFGIFAGGKQVNPLDFMSKFNTLLQ